MQNEKESRVLTAAMTVFLRHGYRRVTMQDIAEEAGISRPALYLIYPNKEEIFKATARRLADESLAGIRDGLKRFPSVEGKLNFAFELWTVHAFELMRASPDAGDVIDCTHGFARETVAAIDREFESMLLDILEPLKQHGKVHKPVIPLSQVAHLLAASAHGYKESAATAPELRSMITGLIKLTLAALQPK
jgi:AcrR family transcriptional regulator